MIIHRIVLLTITGYLSFTHIQCTKPDGNNHTNDKINKHSAVCEVSNNTFKLIHKKSKIMEKEKTDSCGCGSSHSSESQPNAKNLNIEFLYLDLSTCERCQGTDFVIDESLAVIEKALHEIGYAVSLKKIHIQSEECAKKYSFLSSPTIRINGKDIILKHKESSCSSCCDYSGTQTDCRDWEWNGKTYSVPPKGMIMDAILRSIYDKDFGQLPNTEDYQLPENIKSFFKALKEKEQKQSSCAC